MKKIAIVSTCFSLLFFAGCKKSSPLDPLGAMGDCANNATKVIEAAERFATNQTNANCEAYKKAIVTYIKSCPEHYTQVDKEELDEFANMECDFDN